MRSVLLPLSAAMLLISCQTVDTPGPVAAPAGRACDSSAERESVARTIHAFFAALAKDDDAAVRRLTTPSFYAFEVGKRYSGPELVALLAAAHKTGRVINWNIGPISARVDCSIASAAWENIGSAGTAGKLEPRSWLESAVLVRQGDQWLLDFLHSTPKDPRK